MNERLEGEAPVTCMVMEVSGGQQGICIRSTWGRGGGSIGTGRTGKSSAIPTPIREVPEVNEASELSTEKLMEYNLYMKKKLTTQHEYCMPVHESSVYGHFY